MTKRILLVIILYALLFCLPVFLHINLTFPNLLSDYDSNLPIYTYIVSFIWQFHAIPHSIPVVASGIPFWGDPLNSFLNPLFSLPLLIWGINGGLRVSVLFCVIFSGISMLYLLKEWKMGSFLRVTGALLYMSAGTFIAQVSAGHIEKFLVYPFVPLLLLFSMTNVFSLRKTILVAGVITATVYSGDLYNTWFFLLFFFCIRLFYLVKEKKIADFLLSILVVPLFLLFSLLKLYPFLTETLPMMKRFFPIHPTQGSIHAFLLPLQFLVPFQVNFYDRPFFQRHLGFYFNWYEYYAFITPFPFLFLGKIKPLLRDIRVQALLFLLTIGSLYLSLAYIYSPFFYFVKILGDFAYFRVPQRIILPLTSVVIALLLLCAQEWIKEKRIRVAARWIMIGSIVWTTLVGWKTLTDTFRINNYSQKDLIARMPFEKETTVATFALPSQLFLVQRGFGVSNYYYGWVPKNTETYVREEKNNVVINFSKLVGKNPTYIVVSNTYKKDLSTYGYTLYGKNDTISIWKKDKK